MRQASSESSERERRPEQETNTGHGDNTALVTVNAGPHHHQVYSDHWAVSSDGAKIILVRRARMRT